MITTSKEITVKARSRIKKFLSTGIQQSRVYFTDGERGYYAVKHHMTIMRFRIDRLGRVYFS